MKHRCGVCDHEWDARVRVPKSCPKCKRYDWEIIKHKKKEGEE